MRLLHYKSLVVTILLSVLFCNNIISQGVPNVVYNYYQENFSQRNQHTNRWSVKNNTNPKPDKEVTWDLKAWNDITQFSKTLSGTNGPVGNNDGGTSLDTYFEYAYVGFTEVDYDDATMSQWLVSPVLHNIKNGDVIKFKTKARDLEKFGNITEMLLSQEVRKLEQRADKIEVRLNMSPRCKDSVVIGDGPDDIGDFTKLLLTINPNLNPTGYPRDWTEYTITIQGLPAFQAFDGRIAFWYHFPHAGYKNCCTKNKLPEPSDVAQLTPGGDGNERGAELAIGVATDLLCEKFESAGTFMQWYDYANKAYQLYDLISQPTDKGYNGTYVGVDDFEYKQNNMVCVTTYMGDGKTIYFDKDVTLPGINQVPLASIGTKFGYVNNLDCPRDWNLINQGILPSRAYNVTNNTTSDITLFELSLTGNGAAAFEPLEFPSNLTIPAGKSIPLYISLKDSLSLYTYYSATVTLRYLDANSQSHTIRFKIGADIRDAAPPSANCKPSLEFILDDISGKAEELGKNIPLTAGVLKQLINDNSSAGGCSWNLPQLELWKGSNKLPDNYEFSCTDGGSFYLYLKVLAENSDQSDVCTSLITLKDNSPPYINSSNPQTYYLTSNQKGMPRNALVAPQASDNCGASVKPISIYTPFSASGYVAIPEFIGAGEYWVNWEARDSAGNKYSSSAKLNVIDTIKPISKCKPVVLGGFYDELNNFGFINASVFDSASTDNNKIGSMMIQSPAFNSGAFTTSFMVTCANTNTTYPVTLKVIDASGNFATCTSSLKMPDVYKPTCKSQTTIFIPPSSQKWIQASDVMNIMGRCGPTDITFSKSYLDCGDANTSFLDTVKYKDNLGVQQTCKTRVYVADPVTMQPCPDTVKIYTVGDFATYNFNPPAKFICDGQPTYSVYAWNAWQEEFHQFGVTESDGFSYSFDAGIYRTNTALWHSPRGLYNCHQTLVVLDTTKPIIVGIPHNDSVLALNACSRPYTINSDAFQLQSFVQVNYTLSGATTGYGSLSRATLAVDNYYTYYDEPNLNQGVTHITLTARDRNDNISQVSYDVTVYGSLPNPSVTCSDIDKAWTKKINTCDNRYNLYMKSPYQAPCGEKGGMWFYRLKDDNYNTIYERDSIPQDSGAFINIRTSINSGNSQYYNHITLGYHDRLYSTPAEYCNSNLVVYDTVNRVECAKDTLIENYDGSSYTYAYTLKSPISKGCSSSVWSYTVSGATSFTSTPSLAYNSNPVLNLKNGVNVISITSKEYSGNLSTCSFKVSILDKSAPSIGCPANVTIHRTDTTSCIVNIGGACQQINGFTGPFGNIRIGILGGNNKLILNKSNMPSEIKFISPRNNYSDNDGYIKIPINCSGTVSFNWEYQSGYGWLFRPFFLVNNYNANSYSQPAPSGFTKTITAVQSGTFSQSVNAGDVLYIGVTEAGFLDGYLKITNFTAPHADETVNVAQPNFTGNDALYIENDIKLSYPIGNNTIHYTLTNTNNGNQATCTQQLNVVDDYATKLVCHDVTLYLDKYASAKITPNQVVSTCVPFSSTSLSKSDFGCADIGVNTVTVTTVNQTLTNTLTCVFNATVLDTIKPSLATREFNVSLDYYNNVSVSDSMIQQAIRDNCSISSVSASQTSFSCNDAGMHAITLTGTDGSGNTASYTIPVNVYPLGFTVNDPYLVDSVCVGEYKRVECSSGSLENPLMYQWQEKDNNDPNKYWSFYTGSANMQQFLPRTGSHKFFHNYINKYHDDTYMAYIETTTADPTISFRKLNPVNQTWEPALKPIPRNVCNYPDGNNSFYLDFYNENGNNNVPYVVYLDEAGAVQIRAYSNDKWNKIDTTIYWTTNLDFNQRLYFNDGYFFPIKWNGKVYAGKKTNFAYSHSEMWNMYNGGSNTYNTYVSNAKNIVGLRNSNNQNYFFKLNLNSNGFFIPPGYGEKDSLTVDPTNNSSLFALKSCKDTAYVAYKASNGKLAIKKFDGTNSWGTVGTQDVSKNEIFKLDMGVVNDTLYVIYVEAADSIKVKKLKGGNWVEMVSPSIGNPSLTNINSIQIVDIGGVPSFYIDFSGGAHYNAILRNDGWKDINGNSSTYVVNTSIPSDKEYRCIATKYNCTSITSGAKRVIVRQVPEITVSDAHIVGPKTVTLSATKNAGTLKWMDEFGTQINTGTTYSTYVDKNTVFSVYAQNGKCYSDTLESNVFVNDEELPNFTVIYDDTICNGEYAEITLDTTRLGYEYSLYEKGDNGKFNLIDGPSPNPWGNLSYWVEPTKNTDYKIKVKENNFDAVSMYSSGGGTSTYLEMNNMDLNYTKSITLETWVQITYSYPDFNMKKADQNVMNGPYNNCSWNWDVFGFKVYNGNTVRQLSWPSVPISNDGWTHVATTADSNGLAIYYNGVLVASSNDTSSLNINKSSDPLILNQNAYGFVNGFDEFMVWNSKRNETQIQNDMSTCLSGNEAGLLAYNNFNDYNSTTRKFTSLKGNDLALKNYPTYPYYRPQSNRNSTCNDTSLSEVFLPPFTINVLQDKEIVDDSYDYYAENPNCGGEEITLVAHASSGSIKWYDKIKGGNLVGTGDTLRKFVDRDTTFYAEACSSCERWEVSADVYGYPEILSVSNFTVCYGTPLDRNLFNYTTATLNEAESIQWYDAPVGGNRVDGYSDGEGEGGGGSSANNLTQTDTVYAEAYNEYCTALNRVPVIIYVKPLLQVTVNPVSRIGSGTVTLTGTSNTGVINWWDDNKFLGTGPSFITPEISSSTRFWGAAYDTINAQQGNICESDWVSVIAKIYPETKLTQDNCGLTLNNMSRSLYYNRIDSATDYRLLILNSATNYTNTFTKGSTDTSFVLTDVPGILTGTTYTISVASYINGSWTPYGSSCIIITPNTQSRLQDNSCNKTLSNMSQVLYCTPMAGATDYRYLIVNSADSFTTTFTTGSMDTSFVMSDIPGILNEKTYSVSVAFYSNGAWSPYGGACNVTTPQQTTQLASNYRGVTLSDINAPIYCDAIGAATDYKFRIVNSVLSFTSTIAKGSADTSLVLSSIIGIKYSTTYSINVSYFNNGQWAPFGSVYTISTPALEPKLQNTNCNFTQTDINKPIYCTYIPSATNYKYKIVNSDLGYSNVYIKNSADTSLVIADMPNIKYGTSYTITVAYFSNGRWSTYGSLCNLTTPSDPKLKNAYCNFTQTDINQPVYYTYIPSASNYKINIVNSALSYTYAYTKNSSDTSFVMAALPNIKYGTTYTISVAYFSNGRWSAYGSSCNLKTPSEPKLQNAYCNFTQTDINQPVYYTYIPSATNYKLNIVNSALSYTYAYTKNSTDTSIVMVDVPNIKYETTYTISVAYFSNGRWSSYGSSCNVTTPSDPKLQNAYCNYNQTDINKPIYCTYIPSASNYKYKIVNSALSYSYVYIKNSSDTSLVMAAVPNIKYGTTYTINVSYYSNGRWSLYGSPCQITTPNEPKLQNSFCNITQTDINIPVSCKSVSISTDYKFYIVNTATSFSTTINKANKDTTLLLATLPNIKYGTTYSVSVSYYSYGRWSPYGSYCTVTTQADPKLKPGFCGIVQTDINKPLYCTFSSVAASYTCKIVSNETNFSTTVVTSTNDTSITMSAIPNIKYNTTYTITLQYYSNNRWSPFGSPCIVTTPSEPKLQNAYCNYTQPDINKAIYCKYIPTATNYKYKIVNSASSFNSVYIRNSADTSIVMAAVPNIKYGTTYSISVSYFSNGSWSPYGAACLLTTPTEPKLQNAYCNYTQTDINKPIYCTYKPSATNYKYNIVNSALSYTNTYSSNSSDTSLVMTAVPNIKYGTTYSISVSYFSNGRWSPYGAVCLVTTPSKEPKLQNAYCNYTQTDINQPIYCTYMPTASNYRYNIVNSALSYTYAYVKNAADTSLIMDAIPNIKYGTTYSISVAYFSNGRWSPYGAACSVTTQSKEPKLQNAYCNYTQTDINQPIYCAYIPSATNYKYNIVNSALSYTYAYTKNATDTSLVMADVLNIKYGTTYSISVSYFSNGNWSPYGSTCLVTTPSKAPKLQNAYCNYIQTDINKPIYCVYIPTASNYKYKIVNSALGFNSVYNRNSSDTSLVMAAVPNIKYGTTYSISVTYFSNGSWSPYGSVCLVTTPIEPKLQNTYCNAAIKNTTQILYCKKITPAEKYKYYITSAVTSFTPATVIKTAPDTSLLLSSVAGVTYGKTYSISVAYYSNSRWSPYGSACSVIIDSTQVRSEYSNNDTVIIIGNVSSTDRILKIYPNPTSGILKIEGTNQISYLEIVNTLGQVLISKTNPNNLGTLTMDLGELSSGAYLIRMRDENYNLIIQRIIKE